MDVAENPVDVCHQWLGQTVPRVTPGSLTEISLERVRALVRLYSVSSEEARTKLALRRSLRNLFDVPAHFIPSILETLLESLLEPREPDFSPTDLFLISLVTHPLISQLDMVEVPGVVRNYVIRNMARMSGLRSLQLCLSLNLPWSSFFSPLQTVRFTRALTALRVLTFQELADDQFLHQLGQHCLDLASLDVQGSILVTDAGLDSLLSLLKLKYLDVNRTDVSADSLAEFVRRTPSIVSLGSWEEFSDFEEGIFPTLTEISTNSFSLKTNVKISACVSLTKLHLRMTNSSEKIHTVGSLRNLRSLSIADLDFRQSNLGVGLLSLSDTLRDLSLDHVYNWDTLDLKSIGLHCRQLDHLTISNCTIATTNLQPESEQRTKYFTKLSRLQISSNISHSQFLVLTGHAYSLTSLQTGINCWVTTRLLSHLTKLNNLSNLSFLRIDNTKDLSINVLFLILMKAKHLKKIVGVETWKNMDIKICSEINTLFRTKNLPHVLVPFNSFGF